MIRDRISIRGTSDGLIITINSGDWQTILEHLNLKLGQKASFFKGGRVALLIGNRLLSVDEIEAAGRVLAEHQMTLWAINSNAPETRAAAQSLGLETQLNKPAPTPTVSPVQAEDNVVNTTTVIRRTLRSGQSVQYPGNVMIIGDVNPGAEVTAGGHVVVWGRLRGIVHAGTITPDNAFICALKLAPMHLIIGNIISRSPADSDEDQIIPEIAFVQNGQIVAEAWQ